MIYNMAVSVLATCSGARVLAFISNTSFLGWTVRIMDTFGSAVFVGVSDIIRKASAGTGITMHFTKGITSTGGWQTWVYNFRDFGH